jgi:tetratricopeptide (TPR) repeat protein
LNFFHRGNGGSVFLLVGVLAISMVGLPVSASAQADGAQAAFEQALGLLQNGKNNEALAVIDSAIAAGVSDPSLYNLRGLANSELGRDEAAEQSFRTVIHLDPKSPMGYNNLGVLLSKLGRLEDAAAAFREAQTLDPKNFTALLGEPVLRLCTSLPRQRFICNGRGIFIREIFRQDTNWRWRCTRPSNLPRRRSLSIRSLLLRTPSPQSSITRWLESWLKN